jgi:phosphocarrier protein
VEASRTVRVAAADGLHARPCARIAATAQASASTVRLEAGGATADARSVLDLLMLAAGGGSELTVRAQGPDAEAVVDRIARIVTGADKG